MDVCTNWCICRGMPSIFGEKTSNLIYSRPCMTILKVGLFSPQLMKWRLIIEYIVKTCRSSNRNSDNVFLRSKDMNCASNGSKCHDGNSQIVCNISPLAYTNSKIESTLDFSIDCRLSMFECVEAMLLHS